MIREQLKILRKINLLSAVFGGLLLGFPLIPKVSAQPSTDMGYCFDDSYSESLSGSTVVPPGCPRYDYQSDIRDEKRLKINPSIQLYNTSDNVGVIQPPMPSRQMRTMGNIAVDGDTVDVTLNNDTNAQVTYQVIGHTDDRILPGGNEAELLDIPLPVTITIIREDQGLIDIQNMLDEEEGVQFTLQEEGDLTGSKKTIRIQEDGTVFAY